MKKPGIFQITLFRGGLKTEAGVNMRVKKEMLEKAFALFVDFVSRQDSRPFTTFSDSLYVGQEEGYKYRVYDEAKRFLGGKISDYQWKIEDVGSGQIQHLVNEAIKIKNNNLVFRGNSQSYLPISPDEELENYLFSFYKNRITPHTAFDLFLEKSIPYQLIAYLFFIKDKDQYLPISQERFDKIFVALELFDFKTSRNASWENYSTYIKIIKGIREFLQTKSTKPSLLDAHSFLWILGSEECQEYRVERSKQSLESSTASRAEASATSSQIETTVNKQQTVLPVEEDDEISFPEGQEVFRSHRSRERNPALIKAVKEEALKKYGELRCQACGLSFEEKYGALGKGFVEAHHLFPISSLKNEVVTKMSDIAMVCSNCHRMLHRRRPWLSSVDELKSISNSDKDQK